jgi:hypothetical protein
LFCLNGNHSKQVKRIKVVWLALQNLNIDALRIRQLQLLMQRHSLHELVLQRHRSGILGLRSGAACFGHRDFS